MSKELPAKTDLNGAPDVATYKAAIGSLYDFLQSGFFDPVSGGGTANVQTAVLGETGGYKTNRIYCALPTIANTGPFTYEFDSLGAKNVKLIDGSDPYAGAAQAGIPAYFSYNGTNLVFLNPCVVTPRIVNRTHTLVTVANTVTETNIFSYSVPGGTLGTAAKLNLRVNGSIIHSHAGTSAFVVKIYYGATLLANHTLIPDTTDNAGQRPWRIDCDLFANGATNAQKALTTVLLGQNPWPGPTGHSIVLPNNNEQISNLHTIAEDSTAAKNFRVTITHIVANANQKAEMHEATLMFYP